ncbi:hypothetical protein BN871_HW_00040 [Paenibacillus sp. P22]|nr:hypothetical protein BN871_HW_00040 [Paenibacillus sp. P22]
MPGTNVPAEAPACSFSSVRREAPECPNPAGRTEIHRLRRKFLRMCSRRFLPLPLGTEDKPGKALAAAEILLPTLFQSAIRAERADPTVLFLAGNYFPML